MRVVGELVVQLSHSYLSKMTAPQDNNDSDGKGKVIRTALEPAAKEFAEASKGAGKALGETAVLGAKSVKALLAPLGLLVYGYEQIRDQFIPEVERKLEVVPENRRIEPALLIAGPTVEALRFAGKTPELREMFANLLATAMDAETAKYAHPLFVGIIKQLTPDEARILKYIKDSKAVPLIKVRTLSNDGRQEVIKVGESHFFCVLGSEAELQHTDMVVGYIDNVCRLGLCEIPPNYKLEDDRAYQPLENTPEIKDLLAQIDSREGYEAKIDRRGLRLTEFGYRFVSACVSGRD